MVSGSAASVAAQSAPYRQLRYDEDFRYLGDPSRAVDALDAIKYMPFTDRGDVYLTLGGEVRERYEYFHNAQWGAGPEDEDGYLLQRYMLHADQHVGERVRVFGQLKSGIETGRVGGPRPTDEDRLDVHQAFLDVTGGMDASFTLTARLGRQEMQYGSARLVSAREGPNVRQSFDGARLLLESGAWHADVFVTRPVETDPGTFDDEWDRERAFWGAYGTAPLPLLPDGNLDLYFLVLERDQATFDQGTAPENRRSLGSRLHGGPRPWDYNFEAVWQFGSFGAGRIQAWTVASDTGVTLACSWAPRIGFKANITSGDRDPGVASLQTFNALFPRGAYFSETGLIGPANLVDLHPSVSVEPAAGLRVYADWDFFWRQSLRDGLYGVAVNPVRTGQGTDARYVGSQVQLGWEWRIHRYLSVTAIYAHFFAGAFLESSGAGEDVDFVTTWVTFKF
jgi:hypothetical protein